MMKILVIAGWTAAILALAAMFIGHLGAPGLSWVSNHISTYAARAPNDAWITAGMLLSAGALVVISVLISRFQLLGSGGAVHVLPVIIGAVVAGLVLLAMFEETAVNLKVLKRSSFWAVRRQSFHDAGLMVFFYGAIVLAVLAGISCAVWRHARADKVMGVLIAGLGPAAYLLMTSPWPAYIGVGGPSAGLRQRASLLCIWIAMALLLSLSRSGRTGAR